MSTRLPSGGIVIFSGGSAANSLVDVFESIRRSRISKQPKEHRLSGLWSSQSIESGSPSEPNHNQYSESSCSIAYIIPISDNGGSSSELIRVFGGPGIGDVRSRLVRLIPRIPYSKERQAIASLLSGRLSSSDAKLARDAWNDIVDGTSPLWKGISSGKKELMRSFFNLVNLEILKRSRPPSSTFDFTSASVGNLFLTGARLFSGSFESAIYLLSVVCGIAEDQVKVIPSINSNFSHHIAAGLEDGTLIVGQNAISHPSAPDGMTVNETRVGERRFSKGRHRQSANCNISPEAGKIAELRANSVGHWDDNDDQDLQHEEEDAHPPFTLPTLRTKNINFSKHAHELSDLPSRIDRLYYIDSYGQEILPPANPRALSAINHAQSIIYSIGSLYTSIVPSLILRGVGEAMRKSTASTKILILNGSLDREVGPNEPDRPFAATDFVDAIVKAGEQSRGIIWSPDQPSRERSINCNSNNNVNGDGEATGNIETSNVNTGTIVVNASDTTHEFRFNSGGPGLVRRNTLFAPPMLASTLPSRAASPSPSPTRQQRLPGQDNSRQVQAGDSTPTEQLQTSSFTSSSRSSSAMLLTPDPAYKRYVTHVVHLPNDDGNGSSVTGTPYVDIEALGLRGIKCFCVPGVPNTSAEGDGMLYDLSALKSAIEGILDEV